MRIIQEGRADKDARIGPLRGGQLRARGHRLGIIVRPAPAEAGKRAVEKVQKEEEEAESGPGSIFGE